MVDLDTKAKDYDDFYNYDDYYDVSEEVSDDAVNADIVDGELEAAKSGSSSFRDVAVALNALVVLLCCKAPS